MIQNGLIDLSTTSRPSVRDIQAKTPELLASKINEWIGQNMNKRIHKMDYLVTPIDPIDRANWYTCFILYS